MAGTGRVESDDTTRWRGVDADGENGPRAETAAPGIDGPQAAAPGSGGDGLSPYAEAGINPDGDGVHAGVALLKGRDPKTGIGMEVMSASCQIGAQNEISVGEARLHISNLPLQGSETVDVLTAHVGAGTRNPDGSRGLNVGATAIAVGIEGTVGGAGWRGTFGVSMGAGGEASIGFRDADHDGHAEICARAVFSWWTLGGCAELPFASRALVPEDQRSDR